MFCNIPQRVFFHCSTNTNLTKLSNTYKYMTDISVVVSACILGIQIEYSTLVPVLIPDAGIGISSSLVFSLVQF